MDIGQLNIGGTATISLLGAIIAAIGAFISSADQQKAQKKADIVQAELIEKTNKNKQLAAEISEISKKNIALNEKIIGLTSGGDSFAYLAFGKLSNSDNTIRYPVIIQK
ncbi:hypothetical protein CAPTEDRAFT_218003, partial [Capitella teleta]